MIQFNKTSRFLALASKRFFLVVLVAIVSINTFAGDSKSYNTATANVVTDPSGIGKVYVKLDDQTDNEYTENKLSAPDQYFRLFWAIPLPIITSRTFNLLAEDVSSKGYVWGGWWDGQKLLSDDETRTTTVTHNIADQSVEKTYTAKWLKPEVTGVNISSYNYSDEITNPNNAPDDITLEYDIANYINASNFKKSSTNPNFSLGDINIVEGDKATIALSYKPTGVDGQHETTAQLASILYPEHGSESKYFKNTIVKVTENYKPNFSAPYNTEATAYSFPGTTSVGSYTDSPDGVLKVTALNYAADESLLPPEGITGSRLWTAEITQEIDGLFQLVSIEKGNPIVRFNALEDKISLDENQTQTFTAQLSITCTYTDNAGKKIKSDTKTIYLKATAKQTNQVNIAFNINPTDGKKVYDFGSIEIGETPSRSIGITRENILENTDSYPITLKWTNNEHNIFTATYNGGNVTLAINDKADFDCGSFTSTLKIQGYGRFNQEAPHTDELEVTVDLSLSDPEITPIGGNTVVTFSWPAVPGADGYRVLSDNEDNDGNLLDDIKSDIEKTNYTYSVNVKKNGDKAEIYLLAYTDGGCISNIIHSLGEAQLKIITSSTAAATGLTTGVAGCDNDGAFPIKKERPIDVSAAFNGEKAVMDFLFIFGTTTNDTYNTPCYIYKKNPNGTQYDLVGTSSFDMKVEEKPTQLKRTISSNQSLYFTGYCPYGSTGDKDDNGVIHIIGEQNVTVDIYLDTLQLYAKDKPKETITRDWTYYQETIQTDANNYYATGSGSAFVFQSNSKSSSSPFKVNIHIRGLNTLDAAVGTPHTFNIEKEGYGLKSANAFNYSSPISILPTIGGNSQYTELTLDDKWPTETNSNGKLVLTEKDTDNLGGVSIDLGNDKTKLTIDGGQYLFLSKAAAYTTTTYSYSNNSPAVNVSFIAYGVTPNGKPTSGNASGTTNAANYIDINDGTCDGISGTMQFFGKTMTIDGGSFNKEIQHYTADGVKAEKLYNSDPQPKVLSREEVTYSDVYGTIESTGKAEISNFAKMVDDLFPDVGINQKAINGEEYHYPLSAYYVGDKKYGYASLTPSSGKLHLMLPYLDCNGYHLPWQICAPEMTASVAGINMPLGGNIKQIAGCKDHTQSTYTIDRLLYAQFDNYTNEALETFIHYRTEDNVNTNVQITRPEGEDIPLYGTIDDSAAYRIEKKVYMLMPIEAAKWTLFSPPFNVANMYIIESYPETQLVKDFEGQRGRIPGHKIDVAREAQAHRFIDLYTLWYYEEKSVGMPYDFFGDKITDTDGDGVADKYGKFVMDWIQYEQSNTNNVSTNGDYTPVIDKLQHYWAKRDANGDITEHNMKTSHYYLYKAGADWEYDGTNFTSNWIDITDEVKEADGALMKQGETYIMQFPYNSIGGVHDPSTTWDYWTGKYLLIESTAGPHTINGSNYKNSMLAKTIDDESAALCGNATFANLLDMKAPENANYNLWGLKKVHGGGDDIEAITKDSYELESKSKATLAPTEGLLLANFTAPTNMRAKSINYYTGEVEYEKIDDNNTGDIETGLPTIMNGMTLIVEPTSEGLTITPIKEQHVMLFDADGKMIFSKHLSAEENVTLPTGVYVVRGEYEQVKAIKK